MSVSAPATSFNAAAVNRVLADSLLPDWEVERRRRLAGVLADLSLPGRRDENWMRTDLRAFKPAAWSLPADLYPAAVLPDGLLTAAIDAAGAGTEAFDETVDNGRCSELAGQIVSLDGFVQT